MRLCSTGVKTQPFQHLSDKKVRFQALIATILAHEPCTISTVFVKSSAAIFRNSS